MRRRVHYVIRPEHLWTSIAEMARVQDNELLSTLQTGMKYIEEQSFEHVWRAVLRNQPVGKLGKTYPDRNAALCKIIAEIAKGAETFSTGSDTLGDAYEYLIGQFAAGSGKKQVSSTPRNSCLTSSLQSSRSMGRNPPPATASISIALWTSPAVPAHCY
jgi:type I restriction enzyme M protein